MIYEKGKRIVIDPEEAAEKFLQHRTTCVRADPISGHGRVKE
jgi:hypothetical protein